MKLHFSNDSLINTRYRKIKTVINALKIELTQVPHDVNADLTAISVFSNLPILQTPQGSFFSSNTIIRYLAASSGNQLYGGDNLYHRALIDQWLDITTCDFQAAVTAVAILRDGKQVKAEAVLADVHKFLGFVQKHLNNNKFLVGDSPSIADYSLATSISVILTSFGQQERKPYCHLTAWYLSLVQKDALVGAKQLPKESHKAFRSKKQKQQKKKQEKKVQKKQQKKQQEFDPFADDATEQAPKPKKQAPKVEKKKKQKPVAKSIIVFDVKVYEQQYDLDGLWQKIKKQVVMDGLIWNENPKKIPVVGKVFKLQIGCVIEDDKVQTDDIFDKITAWEDDVQSIDVVSFNKL